MKKVAVFLADGFEEVEALATVDILRRAGITCDMVSIMNEMVTGAHNVSIKADKLIDENIENYDMVVCPGGLPGADYLSKDERVLNVIRKFSKEKDKFIAAICASPAMVLSAAGIEEDRYITSYPGEDFEKLLEKSNYVDELVVVDGNIITSRGPATTFLFAYKLVDLLCGDSEKIKDGMLWNMLEEEKE
jgi:4-methyl-5(b-hydroxyethyl)-thiazole monophosphate biosynthesis